MSAEPKVFFNLVRRALYDGVREAGGLACRMVFSSHADREDLQSNPRSVGVSETGNACRCRLDGRGARARAQTGVGAFELSRSSLEESSDFKGKVAPRRARRRVPMDQVLQVGHPIVFALARSKRLRFDCHLAIGSKSFAPCLG